MTTERDVEILEQELKDLNMDYTDMVDKYYELANKHEELKAKQPMPENQQLRLAMKRASGAEAYLEAYEEFYGLLPKGLHTALLLLSGVNNLDDKTRKARARGLANDAKYHYGFFEKVKGLFS